MAIRKFKPYTPGTRQRVVTDFNEITSSKPERSLIISKHRVKGRYRMPQKFKYFSKFIDEIINEIQSWEKL